MSSKNTRAYCSVNMCLTPNIRPIIYYLTFGVLGVCRHAAYNLKRGSVPPRCTLGSAVFHKFSLQNVSNKRALRGERRLRSSAHGGPSSSAFVFPFKAL
jgi:hypothetical protein